MARTKLPGHAPPCLPRLQIPFIFYVCLVVDVQSATHLRHKAGARQGVGGTSRRVGRVLIKLIKLYPRIEKKV